MDHFLGREELALLHVHRPAGGGRGEEEVRLPAQEGGDLEDVAHLRDGGDLRALVDVGQDREPELLLDEGQEARGPP